MNFHRQIYVLHLQTSDALVSNNRVLKSPKVIMYRKKIDVTSNRAFSLLTHSSVKSWVSKRIKNEFSLSVKSSVSVDVDRLCLGSRPVRVFIIRKANLIFLLPNSCSSLSLNLSFALRNKFLTYIFSVLRPTQS